MDNRIGFMQGRLSPVVNGVIQSFPWSNWRDEICTAAALGFSKMEWTLDQHRLYQNPIMTKAGQAEILSLSHKYELFVPSLTGDCFMQAPFWKATRNTEKSLQTDFMNVAEAASIVGVNTIVVPLVDNGAIETAQQENRLVSFLKSKTDELLSLEVRVAFESDYEARNLGMFIERLDPTVFGINYDIGNSAGMGFDPAEELREYAHRITNVHVKDRALHGTTVPLGQGNANFPQIFKLLSQYDYRGNFILQTARAADGNHADVLQAYGSAVSSWLLAARKATNCSVGPSEPGVVLT